MLFISGSGSPKALLPSASDHILFRFPGLLLARYGGKEEQPFTIADPECRAMTERFPFSSYSGIGDSKSLVLSPHNVYQNLPLTN
jgi:hypothetical protein